MRGANGKEGRSDDFQIIICHRTKEEGRAEAEQENTAKMACNA